MNARIKHIDLETWQVVEIPLSQRSERVVVGRARDAEIVVQSDRVARRHCAFVRERGQWRIEDLRSVNGTWLNGRSIGSHALSHGDAVLLFRSLLIFLDTPPASANPAYEAAIDEAPDDGPRIKVWADWLQEHGDPLGEQLLQEEPEPRSLEGLDVLVREGRVEFEWSHGLIKTARLRCIDDATWSDAEVLARFLSLRIARWTRDLTIDLSTWVMPSMGRLQGELANVLRGLLHGPHLPCLERLSFGYFTEAVPPSPLLATLLPKLRERFPRLKTDVARLLAPVQRAWLEVLDVPPGLDFHAPGANGRELSLESGLWVGAAGADRLRAVPPGVRRTGAHESFIVRQEPPRWCLIPVENGLKLNGRAAFATRLLPGDVIEVPRGVRFRFGVS